MLRIYFFLLYGVLILYIKKHEMVNVAGLTNIYRLYNFSRQCSTYDCLSTIVQQNRDKAFIYASALLPLQLCKKNIIEFVLFFSRWFRFASKLHYFVSILKTIPASIFKDSEDTFYRFTLRRAVGLIGTFSGARRNSSSLWTFSTELIIIIITEAHCECR